MTREKRSCTSALTLSPSGSKTSPKSNIESPPKRRRNALKCESKPEPQPEPSTTEFLDMNNDCIDRICSLLALDDLCSMGRTCKRIHNIAGHYFQRHYPNNYVRIQSFRRRTVYYMYPNEKYVEDLKPFIRNVSIQEYKGSVCVNYLKANFGENLREIALHGINCDLSKTHGIQIKGQLKRLESIKFVNCSVGDIYEIFLKHCEQLQHIGIDEPIQHNGTSTWPQYSFPTLQSIAYFDEANTNRADFGGFLRRNPQIKSIACKGSNVLCTVLSRAKQLDNLVVGFNSGKDFNRHFSLIKSYSEHNQTPRIKLEFGKHLEMDMFMKLTQINNVYGYRGYFSRDIGLLTELRVLQLHYFGDLSQLLVKRLAERLSNLEELQFSAFDIAISCKNLLIPFCQNPKLQKIAIQSTQIVYRCTKNDIVDIEKMRASSNNCAQLTIFMEKEVIDTIKFKRPTSGNVLLKPLSELGREIHSFEV